MILPTGDWAEVSASNPAVVIELKNKQFKKFAKLSISSEAIKELRHPGTDIKDWLEEFES